MNEAGGVTRWIDEHRDLAVDLVRIYLGIGLFVKGLQFLSEQEFLTNELRAAGAEEFKFDFLLTFAAHYIPLAHIGGGLLLAVGLLTRVSALFQLPILIGAVTLSFAAEGLFTHNQNLQFEALVLFLLILILVYGAGRLSVDHALRTR